MGVDEQLLTVAQALGKVTSQADKAQIGATLFGDNWIPALQVAIPKIQQLSEEYDKSGRVATGKGELFQFRDSYNNLNDKAKELYDAFADYENGKIDIEQMYDVARKNDLYDKDFESVLDIYRRDVDNEVSLKRSSLQNTLSTLGFDDAKIEAITQHDTEHQKDVRAQAYRDWETDRKSTRLNSSHEIPSRMPSSA